MCYNFKWVVAHVLQRPYSCRTTHSTTTARVRQCPYNCHTCNNYKGVTIRTIQLVETVPDRLLAILVRCWNCPVDLWPGLTASNLSSWSMRRFYIFRTIFIMGWFSSIPYHTLNSFRPYFLFETANWSEVEELIIS